MAGSEPEEATRLSSRSTSQNGEETEAELRARKIEELQYFILRWSENFEAPEDDNPPEEIALSDYPIANEPPPPERSSRRKPSDMGDWARIAYDNRRLRDSIFNEPGLFADPAWDMLLDLTRSESAGRRLAITDLSIGSCVPNTTALRWIMVLEDRGFVRREHDLLDARRTFIRLTKRGVEMMQRYFSGLARRKDGGALFFRQEG